MNIKVNLQDGTPAQFKTEIIDGAIVVTVVEEKQEVNLFPKWEELEEIKGYCIDIDSEIFEEQQYLTKEMNQNVFTTEDLAKASLATARVSQTYRRYRELVGEVNHWGSTVSIVRYYGLLYLVFRNESDWKKFHNANKEDLDLIASLEDSVQI